MRRHLLSVGLLCAALFGSAGLAQAQSSSASDTSSSAVSALQAVITGPQDLAVGRTIVLDGSSSRTNGLKVHHEWFVGDQHQPISRSVEAVYTPEKSGTIIFRLVITADQDGVIQTSEALHTITVYDRKIVLIADASVSREKLVAHREAAAAAGVFLRVLQAPPSSTPVGNEEALTAMLTEESESLAGANAIVLWTQGVSGLQALMSALQNDAGLLAGIHNQMIVLITDQGLSTLARTARGPYSVLRPEQILVTRKEAVDLLLSAKTTEEFLQQVDQRDIEYVRVDAATAGFRPWTALSFLVNAMLAKGVPVQTVILLLVLPIIATMLAFFKQVIGITTFGLFTPSIIALSFLALGWPVGMAFLLFIVITGYATRAFMKRWRLLYVPKVAIILTVVSITLLILMGIGAFYGVTFSRETIFILLIMSTLAESFLNLQTEEGWYSAVMGIVETVAAALICVFIVQWPWFQAVLLAYPELILLTIVINAFLGKWTGLRLTEYFRFREVFKHLQEE